ncbi:MarR family protein [Pigmentiphaga humi]|uniref:MarR family protein n=1 Tax=Pigmentiphaga humi TaxID=2478468 RepID=A0A3P4B193_9BURK|nr:MarR family winged helix-turn-helix transcriptional regulator [Pigmentiphaga humi]VCU69346.1 MarR family protein [Pigmentiphaga humi]
MSTSRSPKPASYQPPATTSRREFIDNGSDQVFRESIYGIVRALDALMSCREVFSKAMTLTGSQFAVLMGTAYKQGAEGVTIRELAEHVRLAAPHVTTEVGRLIRKKLLVKRPNHADGRSVLVSLSPNGEAEVARISPLVRKVNDHLFQGITAEELTVVTRAMKTLVLNSERVLAEVKWGDMMEIAPPPPAPGPRGKK